MRNLRPVWIGFVLGIAIGVLGGIGEAQGGAQGGGNGAGHASSNCRPILTHVDGARHRAQRGWDAKHLKTRPKAQARVREQARCVPEGKPERFVRRQIRIAKSNYKTAKKKGDLTALYEDLTNPPGQDWLAAVRVCESGDNYDISPGGAYGMLQGWAATAGWYADSGWPEPAASTPPAASHEQQDIRASLLYQHYGGGPWPNCP